MPRRTSLILTLHALGFLLCAGALWALSIQKAKSRQFAAEMEAIQKAGRLGQVSRKPDSDVISPDEKGVRLRRITWRDRVGQVTYIAVVEPEKGTLLDFNQLFIEYRVGWLALWQGCWLALALIGLSLAVQVVLGLMRSVTAAP